MSELTVTRIILIFTIIGGLVFSFVTTRQHLELRDAAWGGGYRAGHLDALIGAPFDDRSGRTFDRADDPNPIGATP